MRRYSVNALVYKDNPPLMREYLKRNGIVGCFLSRDKFWQVYEALTATAGYLAAEFTYRADALKFIEEWCATTQLPRLKKVGTAQRQGGRHESHTQKATARL